MVASAIFSIAVLGFISVYSYINKSIQSSKSKSLAANLAQEKIESLKNITYPRLIATTSTVDSSCGSTTLTYDTGYFPQETLTVGDVRFSRAVYIRKMGEDASKNLQYRNWDETDTGIKEVLVHVSWQEGGSCKYLSVRNLRDDPDRLPLDATFSGTITSGTLAGPAISGARVEVLDNPSWAANTAASGNYSFNVSAGTYTLKISSDGFFSSTRQNLYVESGGVNIQNVPLIKMASGTVSGYAWLRDHLVISQVVGSTENPSGVYQEYVELFNPTTYTWTIAADATTPVINLKYQRFGESEVTIALDYSTLTIPPNKYYLVANTGTIRAVGVVRPADAVYKTTNAEFPNIIKIDADVGANNSAGLGLSWVSDGTWIDRVGWSTTGHTPPIFEGSPIPQNAGLEINEQYVRLSVSTGVVSGLGKAYDSNNNSNDFATDGRQPMIYPPKNTSDSETTITGTPALKAMVSASDGLSSPVYASASNASFALLSVATGTWTVEISSGLYYTENSSVTVAANSTTNLAYVYLTTSTTKGYVSGTVKNSSNSPLPGIKVSAPGITPVTTDSQGNYKFSITSGTYEVTANPGNYDTAYTLDVQSGVNVNAGQWTSGINFTLSNGGALTGFATTNGVDPFPGMAVEATLGGLSKGTGISSSQGRFTVSNLPVGVYEVAGYAPSGETVTPSTFSATVSAGSTVFVGTYTVSGAFGKISGALKQGTSPIKTGVLIVATTSTIAGANPPDVTPAVRSGGIVYYAGSSMADGTYSVLLPGATYNVYAWYTTFAVDVPSSTKKSGSKYVTPGGSATLDFTW